MSFNLHLVVQTLSFLLIFSCTSSAAIISRLTSKQSLNDGDVLVSNLDDNSLGFTLGFFGPGNTTRYLGIWYKQDCPQSGRSVIWVGNPLRPIPDRSGVLTIAGDGNLILSDGNGSNIWKTRVAAASKNTVAVLLETGNLILLPESSADLTRAYWQSFNEQTDTFVPGMQVLVDASARPVTNDFCSWRSKEDPYPGRFTMGVDPQGGPQIMVWENRQRLWRTGMWNGEVFTGLASNSLYEFNISSSNDGKTYLSCAPKNASDLLRFRVESDGRLEVLRRNSSRNSWDLVKTQPSGYCQQYNFCGKFGICDEMGSPNCRCMEGFEAEDLGEWRKGNWSGGCRRITPLECGNGGNEFRELRSGKFCKFTAGSGRRLSEAVITAIVVSSLLCLVSTVLLLYCRITRKLQEGGFDPVYNGRLPSGEEIAVKRLSRISGQGLEEFKNEINVIAKLQHRNLVRLLGYCVQEDEKMVVYEYMSNKSLDFFLFDPTKQTALDWGKRLTIIEGIARGLLYLHRDSRLRVIHRDLKANNVLLDNEINPKISDFGMAKIFGGNQNEAANTIRVVGT
ncbi:Putative G-type lectin S-receptor-like serine/threonine-protein kinase At1g61610 [Linum grandiflorum]